MTARSIGEVLTGQRSQDKHRRTYQPVWRSSRHVGEREGEVWRPIADGTRRGARRYIGHVIKQARLYELRTRRARQANEPGARNGALGDVGVAVLEVLYRDFVDYRSGRCEPAIASIAARIGKSYAAVHAALVRLRDAGFLRWLRRTRPKDNPDPFGPQVEQAPNAYGFCLPDAIQKILRKICAEAPVSADLCAWEAENRANSENYTAPELRHALSRMSDAIDRQEAQNSASIHGSNANRPARENPGI